MIDDVTTPKQTASGARAVLASVQDLVSRAVLLLAAPNALRDRALHQLEILLRQAKPGRGGSQTERTRPETSYGTSRENPAWSRQASQPEASLAREGVIPDVKRRQRVREPRDRAPKSGLLWRPTS